MSAGKLGSLKRVGAMALLLVLNVALLVSYRRLTQRFSERMRHLPSFAAPATFTEKIHWRKIFDDDPRFAIVLDKLKAKEFVRDRLPWLLVPAVLWRGDDPREIPFDELTIPYIVKCNHGCNMNAVVPDPATADRDAIIAEMSRHLAETYGSRKLERGYAHIKPQVFVETLIGKDHDYQPIDYKFNVIAGRVAFVVVTSFRSTVRKTALFDRDWRRLAVVQGGIDASLEIARPQSFSRMVEAAEILGGEFDMMRVDFYEDGGEPVFGEFTIYPRSGLQQFEPPAFDRELGACWDIAASGYLSRPSSRFARRYRAVLVAAGRI
ncbi:hypothetical protein LRP31_22875 [Mesorhizobium mediterraneum]|uniref:Glycosyl transferase n=1 Tax=Mesorhizobium mediterraneum TaxID=43617 RepID=A0AB36QZ90_9HYPH|nr:MULTISPECIES: ATP-grasp fold amidoligase family protein [Mesorhizobium]AZO68696.1 hypothetical protein EJ075_29825 [Mesorhizobium sp. M6A.T.Cr.TU.016.01.1.1]PAP97681.1 hypothetical protein CIT25_34285 [Mesorhizobium mediterraneum]RUU38474.1 hypothetical protein EOC93_23185 [Mesorhizobium sp. M6A.T.Ce.TU.002.03.1.1]RVB79777.1 hypothetical protein EN885_02500 [Mesorhizobium sp. M6A.T.Cr.TU.014.01.1.1]RWN38595.1 MAG: hypothetical protein EOR96_21330 [Mesorhizobium sp.]